MSQKELLEAIQKAAERLQLVNHELHGPVMQVMRITIDDVTYELFGPKLPEPTDHGPGPTIQAIEFGEYVPMQVVIRWLQKAQAVHDRGLDSRMQ